LKRALNLVNYFSVAEKVCVIVKPTSSIP
jgi:hypothetical protein